MESVLFLLLSVFSVWVTAVIADKGSALFTDLKLEIFDSYAIPDQVSDLYLRIILPFDEARSSATQANTTKLWRAKAWASTLKQGGGEKVGFEKQILSRSQAATPLDLSKNPLVIDEVVCPLDLVGHDCSVATFICVRLQAWDNGPDVLFEYENGKKIERATECVSVNCTDDVCAGIYCDIPVCAEGHYIDYAGEDCCPGCIPGGPLNQTESDDEIQSLDCGEHKDGDRWIERKDELNCLEMRCDSGEIDALAQQCPETHCDNPLFPADSCCPVCLAPSRDRCSLEPSRGRCLAYFARYYFDSASGSCASFVYGGCGGNDNRFDSIEDCEAACGSPEVTKSVDCGEYKDGDRWINRADELNCMMMSCDSGDIIMAMVACEFPECDSPVYPEDSCCPICPEGEVFLATALPEVEDFVTDLLDMELTTWVDDAIELGVTEVTPEVTKLVEPEEDPEVTEAEDVELTTVSEDVIESVEPVEDPDVLESEDAELTTVLEDLTTELFEEIYVVDQCGGYGELETWEPQPCERCTCINGTPICSQPICIAPECDDPLPAEGICCQVCPEPACVEGDEWSPDPCTQCTCEEGKEVCEPVVCPVTGCLNPRKVAGECCKKCLAPLRARPINIGGKVAPRVWRAGRTTNPRFDFEVRTFSTSENVTGEGLWKLSVWVDSTMEGTGDRLFFKEQVLNAKQASQPLYASQSIFFNNIRHPVGGPGIDCPETIHYYCFRFQMGDDPSVPFRFLAPRQQSSVMRCIRAPCAK